ncbi:MAG: glycosyltransferase family 4 protein [Phycisphaeraceae bacterium]
MRIALVIENFNPEGGGAERNVAEMARHLTARQHAVTILCADTPDAPPTNLDGIRVEKSAKGKPRLALGLWRFSRWATQRTYDGSFDVSLSVNNTVPATVLQPLGGTVKESQKQYTACRPSALARGWKRFCLALTPKQRLLRRLEKKSLRDPRVKRIAALSDYVVRMLVEGYGVAQDRIALIPNAVDVPAVSSEQRAAWRAQVRQGFKVPVDSVAYVFPAFNPRLKGVVPLMLAFKKLREKVKGVTLVLAGANRYEDQHRAVALGIREGVRFIGQTQNMPMLYCAADVTVLPTFYDPSSRVVIESIALETPAITTLCNGAAGLITKDNGDRCGRVVADPWDIDGLAQAMAELADPEERRRCASACHGRVQQLSMTRHVDQVEALLEACVKEGA